MNPGPADLSVLDAMPLDQLKDVLRALSASQDLVDQHVAAAVANALEAGVSWGSVAEVLRQRHRTI